MGEGKEVTVSRVREGEHEVSTGGCGGVWLLHPLSLFREAFLMQRGVKGPRNRGATEATRPRGRGWPPLQKPKLYLSLGILGGITVAMFTLLGMLAYSNTFANYKTLKEGGET